MIADLAMQRALDRYHKTGATGLSEEQKTLATLWCFESRVANGGFEHFFRSTEGELAAFGPAAFRNIGAEKLASIAEQANAVFGAGGVPENKSLRTKLLEALPESERRTFDALEAQYLEYGKDLDAQVEAYAVQHGHGGH